MCGDALLLGELVGDAGALGADFDVERTELLLLLVQCGALPLPFFDPLLALSVKLLRIGLPQRSPVMTGKSRVQGIKALVPLPLAVFLLLGGAVYGLRGPLVSDPGRVQGLARI